MKFYYTVTKSGNKYKTVDAKCVVCSSISPIPLTLYRKLNYVRTCVKCSNKTRTNTHRIGVSPANFQIKCLVPCNYCGTPKNRSKNQLTKFKHTFCNASCQIKWQLLDPTFNRGERNPSFRHGERVDGRISSYGPDFTSKLKREIKIRDGYNCQRCKINCSGKLSKNLDVHHIDQNKFNNDPSNLISLCKKCHTSLHWECYSK